jgi:archaellum component FlaC
LKRVGSVLENMSDDVDNLKAKIANLEQRIAQLERTVENLADALRPRQRDFHQTRIVGEYDKK